MYEFSQNETNSYFINQRNLKSDRNIRVMIRVSKSNNHKSNKQSNNKLNPKENFNTLIFI